MDFYHLVDFLEQINHKFNMIDKKNKNFIIKESLKNPSEEICGFIVLKNNNFICMPCENIAKNKKENFMISSLDYIKIKNYSDKILYIYHSHVNDNENFSQQDISCSENLCLPIIMYNLNTKTFKIHEPISIKKEYIGRFYQHAKYDCFKLIEEFYKKEKFIEFKYDNNFYSKSLEEMDIKTEVYKFYMNNNFEIIDNKNDIKLHDILLIDAFGENKPKHFALYMGQDKILHQPMFGFSKIENYCNFYRRHTDSIFRLKI